MSGKYKELININKNTQLRWYWSPDSLSFSGGFYRNKYGWGLNGGLYLSLFYWTLEIGWEIKKEGDK